MSVSVFELFKIGIGPSSSHTVGPMRAACTFVNRLAECAQLDQCRGIRVTLFGSLAHTGRGHGTDKAVMLGLQGELPDRIDPDVIPERLAKIESSGRIKLAGSHEVDFSSKQDLVFNKRSKLPYHPNGMRFTAWDCAGEAIMERDYYSVGGGFVVNQDEAAQDRIVKDRTIVPYPFGSGDALLRLCHEHDLSIAQLMMANEKCWRSEAEIVHGLQEIWAPCKRAFVVGITAPGCFPAD